MSRTTPSTILPIQRAMAGANPRAWRDGLVVEVHDESVTVLLLEGTVTTLRVADARGTAVVGDPVAHHPVAEILTVGGRSATARAVR
ncbi:nuclease [Curtobacterium sp. MCSS17_008]|uniref:nuclease n=1 Tax=Curtobacterium sp. MCSS17_008 TaxID=2175647 RepID=UPI000DA95673|nr:nuclease [Curtobacterium sp. MCSS17_008]PZF57725.1 nuclease [Curtobacterium sp. MCSS17_008]